MHGLAGGADPRLTRRSEICRADRLPAYLNELGDDPDGFLVRCIDNDRIESGIERLEANL